MEVSKERSRFSSAIDDFEEKEVSKARRGSSRSAAGYAEVWMVKRRFSRRRRAKYCFRQVGNLAGEEEISKTKRTPRKGEEDSMAKKGSRT